MTFLEIISSLLFDNSKIQGRANESSIRINDISVSRIHSKIRCSNGKYFLEDTGSKFGTIIKIEDPIILNQPIVLQTGRTVFEIKIKKKYSLLKSIFSKGKQ